MQMQTVSILCFCEHGIQTYLKQNLDPAQLKAGEEGALDSLAIFKDCFLSILNILAREMHTWENTNKKPPRTQCLPPVHTSVSLSPVHDTHNSFLYFSQAGIPHTHLYILPSNFIFPAPPPRKHLSTLLIALPTLFSISFTTINSTWSSGAECWLFKNQLTACWGVRTYASISESRATHRGLLMTHFSPMR